RSFPGAPDLCPAAAPENNHCEKTQAHSFRAPYGKRGSDDKVSLPWLDGGFNSENASELLRWQKGLHIKLYYPKRLKNPEVRVETSYQQTGLNFRRSKQRK